MNATTLDLSSYDWIVINSSAGKDSQTMLRQVVLLAEKLRINKSKLVVVHANLEEEEWPGTRELAEEQALHYGLRFETVRHPRGSLLDHVRRRRQTLDEQGKHAAPPWMGQKNRWCTSDHKRGPVGTLFTKLAAETRLTRGSKHQTRILNCLGMRAEESSARAKLAAFSLNEKFTTGRKLIHDWLPIHDWTEDEVWANIRASGVRHHWAYDLGMPRLSCCFCIFAPRDALLLAGHHNTELLRKYVAVEEEVRSTFRKELPLASVLADVEAGVQPKCVPTWEM